MYHTYSAHVYYAHVLVNVYLSSTVEYNLCAGCPVVSLQSRFDTSHFDVNQSCFE